jgi:hypothetical protein
MATITSVNNTTVGLTYNIHDPATWIGGVVPGPGDTVVFQSATATTWYLTQSWTIGTITWSVSLNRSESGIEIPSTLASDITFTQLSGNWVGTGPMVSTSSELRAKPFLKVLNPAGTTVTINLPGAVYYTMSVSSMPAVTDTSLITLSSAGNCYLNINGYVGGFVWADNTAAFRNRTTIRIHDISGYTEVNCTYITAGYSSSNGGNANGQGFSAFWVTGILSGGEARVNGTYIPNSTGTSAVAAQWGTTIRTNNSLLGNGVTFNLSDYIGYNTALSGIGNIWAAHTSGTLTLIAPQINAGQELWTQGYNDNWEGSTTKRRVYYCSADNVNSVTVFDADIYGPNNTNNTLSSNNYMLVTNGAVTHKIYGNIYTSTLNRYQVPFYYDSDSTYWYHMEGTAYNSISSVVWSTRVQYIGFYGGFYHANVVQSNDPVNLYAANRAPFIVPLLGPNPNYSGGNQLSWVYIKGPDNRAQTTTMINANYTGFTPAPADVRSGVVYGNGAFTGTCAVPQPFQVAFGVPVDATVGTWTGETNVLSTSAIAESVWNYDLNDITNTTNGSGQRLLNNATIESTGAQIAALGV